MFIDFLLFLLKTAFGIAKNFLMFDLEWRIRGYWISEIFESALFTKFMHFEREKPGVIYNNRRELSKRVRFIGNVWNILLRSCRCSLSPWLCSLEMLACTCRHGFVVVLLVLRFTIMSKRRALGPTTRN